MNEDVTDARMQIQVVKVGVEVTGDAPISLWQDGDRRAAHGCMETVAWSELAR